jgi:hypothetical protein
MNKRNTQRLAEDEGATFDDNKRELSPQEEIDQKIEQRTSILENAIWMIIGATVLYFSEVSKLTILQVGHQ